jgi:dienelactone hydrolase
LTIRICILASSPRKALFIPFNMIYKHQIIALCLAIPDVSVCAKPLNISFPSLGETVVGDLYLPIGNGPFPAVVTGPGFAGVKEMLIPDYANALASAGIATLAIDYIGFGASSGKVRQDIKTQDQITSYKDALGVLEKDNRFDPKRLGAWGTSLGGAHTLVVSANDPRVKAAVAIIPHIELDPAAMEDRISMVDAIEADVKAAEIGGKRVMVAVSGNPGDKAAMTSDGAVAWTKDVTKNAPLYRNEVTASSLLAMSTYSTVADAANIKIPLRAITAKDDSITPASKIHKALDGVKGVDFKDFPGTHFGLFGANLTATIDLTVDWFVTHLK